MEVKINQKNLLYDIELNGQKIERVKDYKLTSSAQGGTELEITLSFKEMNVALNTICLDSAFN